MACSKTIMRLLGAARDDDIIGRDEFLVALLGVANDGLLERRNTVRRRVPYFAGIQNSSAANDGVDGGFTLGLAAAQVNDRFALLAQQRRGLVQLQSS